MKPLDLKLYANNPLHRKHPFSMLFKTTTKNYRLSKNQFNLEPHQDYPLIYRRIAQHLRINRRNAKNYFLIIANNLKEIPWQVQQEIVQNMLYLQIDFVAEKDHNFLIKGIPILTWMSPLNPIFNQSRGKKDQLTLLLQFKYWNQIMIKIIM